MSAVIDRHDEIQQPPPTDRRPSLQKIARRGTTLWLIRRVLTTDECSTLLVAQQALLVQLEIRDRMRRVEEAQNSGGVR